MLACQHGGRPAEAANSRFLTVYSWPQYTLAGPGSLLSLPTSALYICSAVPTKHLQPGRSEATTLHLTLDKLRLELMWGSPATASHEQCVAGEDELVLGPLLLTEETDVTLRMAASRCTG